MALDSSISEQNDGYLDLSDLACRLSTKSTRTNFEGESTTHKAETYLIGKSLYTCDNDEWKKYVVPDSFKAIEERDELRSLTKIVSGSKAVLIGSEQIDGEDCYKLRFTPDPDVSRKILASLALMAMSASPVELPDMDMEALANDEDLLDDKIVWTAWISADDYILRRVVSDVRLSLTPESLHPPQEAQDLRVESASQKTTTFSGFNEKKPVVLPDEAEHAKTTLA
jgi:hypothetical protein